jgi:hypothetical protein
MLSFSISYRDLIKFPYFADTTERGDRGWKTGDFMDNSKYQPKRWRLFVLQTSLWLLAEVLFSLHIGIRFVGMGLFIGNPKFTQDPMLLKGIAQ